MKPLTDTIKEPELANEECIEIMRSLPIDNITSLMYDSIFNSESLEFLNFININKNYINILKSPSQEDKIILLNVIKKCIDNFKFDDNQDKKIFKSVFNVYNKTNLAYTELDDINYYDVLTGKTKVPYLGNLNFLSKDTINTIDEKIKSESKLSIKDNYLFKTQMFIYASVWFDMDEYLKYLYYLYK